MNLQQSIKTGGDVEKFLSQDFQNACEYKFEFKNQRSKPTHLAAPLLASNRVNFAINRALLTV